jgi:hypothetical protein
MLAIKRRSLFVVDTFVGNVVDKGTRFGGGWTLIATKRSIDSTMSRRRIARRNQVRRRCPGLRNGLISMCIGIAAVSSDAISESELRVRQRRQSFGLTAN